MKPHHNNPFTKMVWLFIATTLGFVACKHKTVVTVNPEFAKYINSYTSGVVSKKASIKIELATDASVTHTLNEVLTENLFSFSPSVKGKAFWVDAKTIEFKPDEDLQIDKLYTVEFKLNKVLNVPAKFKNFEFNIQTLKPSIEVQEHGLKAINKELMSLTGSINTADVEDSKQIEKILLANFKGNSQKIKWQHNETAKTYFFTIDSIQRSSSSQTLTLNWDASIIKANQKDKIGIEIPAIGEFKVLSVKAMQEDEQYALVQFSDVLMVGQILDGLITISNQATPSYTILGSEVKVYGSSKLDGNFTVNVNTGIQDMWGKKLTNNFTANIFFENRLPNVSIFGQGVILPNSGGKLLLPFDATNLKAVDVSIIKIYESNIPQFFQQNKMDNSNNLRAVAKPLVQATIKLDNDKSLNLHKKNRFFLDVDKYLKTEPGAMYHVAIGFRPQYSLYSCSDAISTSNNNEEEDYYDGEEVSDEDDAFWSRYNNYYPFGYDWEGRDNPCSKAFYTREKFAFRNILATNIGLTAKRGVNNSLMIAANNILTTEPLSGVSIEALDYQQQIIGKANSNNDGIALLETKRKPFLVVAKKGNEKSYLRVDDGSSLPLSRFSVDGAQVKNGIKGFVFGERGVWRPGDSLFLSCIIEDKEKKLPAGHPLEMELISPRGQLYKRIVQPNNANGFNVFKTATDANAPTGNWWCKVKCGGAIFDKQIKIETVIPNRLKINVNFNGATALGKDVNKDATLNANWLFGAAAQNLKARVDAQLYNKETSFDNYKGYVFESPINKFSPQSKTVFDGSLNATGAANFNTNFSAGENAPGMLLANLMVKVFEPGGNFSIDNVSLPYHPYSSYTGIKMPAQNEGWGYYQPNKTYLINVAEVNNNGTACTATSDMEVELYKVQWRWWWDRSEESFSNFTQDEYNKLVKKETFSFTNKINYTLRVNGGDYGRYLILFKNKRTGHTTGSSFYVSDNDWRYSDEGNNAGAISMLSFTSNKAKYSVGEDCKLTIPSSANGKMLVSIETGTKVLKTMWVATKAKETNYSFAIEKGMAPNIYVNITMLQPHAQTVNDLPIRMYGVIPIEVEDKNTILHPTIKINNVLRPEETSSITVSEQDGKKMEYVIAIVDEGLLDLTRFKTPNPHGAFYAKEALGVKTWDVYDYVIGAWGGQLQRILTIGGDGEAETAAKTRKANRFKPVVKFLGPFSSNGGSKTHEFVLPNYMGSVRAMVIAAGNGAYGVAEKAVPVKKPLMLLATMPRVLGPSEDVKIPITVFATENTIKNVSLSVQANNMLDVTSSNNNVSFSNTGEQMAYLTAKVKNTTGIGKLKVVAKSGTYTSYQEIEIEVRNPNNTITQTQEFTLAAGQTINTNIAMLGDASSSNAVVEVSSIPSINLQKRLRYLMEYPHGCIEQTTSAIFPQLTLNSMLELNEKQKADVERNLRVGIQKLQNFVTQDGGFAYWPGNMSADEWGTNYAGHFLLEAQALGYTVSSSVLQNWKAYQRNTANAWNVTAAPWYGTDLVQAYRLYLLALAKAPEQGAMNRLKEFKFLSAEAKWRLAAAYYLIGQTSVANQLISGVPTNFTQRAYAGISFGSHVRDEAMVLETLVLMNRQAEANQLVRTIAANLSSENWYSTQTTAYGLLAIAKYCGISKDNKLQVSGNAGATKISVNANANVSQQTVNWQNGAAGIKLTNNGKNTLFVKVINQGKPVGMQPVVYNNNANVLSMTVSFLTTQGAAIDVTKLKQGTDFVAKVTITNPGKRGAYTQMALSQIFPSGWEILNTRMYNSEGAFQSSPADYMDIKDDRVYHYFNLNPNQTLTYYVQLNAAYLGKFYWSGAYAEAMYDNSISAGVGGKLVEVE